MTNSESTLQKRKTGIRGLDEVTRGGLPAAGATLITGTPGAGKTVLCLQILANSIQAGNGAVFLSFEESRLQIASDAASFLWADVLLGSDLFTVVDARQSNDVSGAGEFDLDGLLALIDRYTGKVNAHWIVLDGIDHLLRMNPAESPLSGHFHKLNDWCRERQLSLLLTAKATNQVTAWPLYLEGVNFLLDCVINLSADQHGTRLNRRFRIMKYRGTGHITNELPLVIDSQGLHLPYADTPEFRAEPAVNERCSTGIERLDEILGGGIYRGSTTLISGQPGTSKTTLAAGIAHTAAERGERVLYVSFDEMAERFVHNLTSVGIRLTPHIKAGRIQLNMREAWRYLVEEHYIAISQIMNDMQPDWLVIDPVSALIKAASVEGAHISTERILGDARARGASIVLTSLSLTDAPENEGTLSHASTLADTWISLSYNIRGGERNRALSIVKSRGTAHSNQVRELLLASDGIDLADVYQFGTEVLMGTARYQKQMEEEYAETRREQDADYRQRTLNYELEKARRQIAAAQDEEKRLKAELEMVEAARSGEDLETSRYFDNIRDKRQSASGAGTDRNKGAQRDGGMKK